MKAHDSADEIPNMIETHQLVQRIKEAVGLKRFAQAVGRSLGHVYGWTHDPHDPNSDGKANLFDWLEATVDLLASRPEGRPVLLLIRSWFNALIDRGLGAWTPQPMTRDGLAHETSRALREFSDLVDECGAEDFCRERLVKEGAEAIEAIERLMRSVSGGVRKIG